MRFALLLSALFLTAASLPAQGAESRDPYIVCSFYPAKGLCDDIYRRAASEASHPAAESALAEYQSYVRYLTIERDLTDADLEWLGGHRIKLPDTLTPAQRGGLHQLLNDPTFAGKEIEKERAVHGFIGRAVQHHFYCIFNECPKQDA